MSPLPHQGNHAQALAQAAEADPDADAWMRVTAKAHPRVRGSGTDWERGPKRMSERFPTEPSPQEVATLQHTQQQSYELVAQAAGKAEQGAELGAVGKFIGAAVSVGAELAL